MSSPGPRILHKQESAPQYFFAPCPRGLSSVLREELVALDATNAAEAEAGVSFTGPFELMYAANLHSRIASRILWRVAQFPYANEDDIYRQGREVRWRDHFSAERTFKVE